MKRIPLIAAAGTALLLSLTANATGLSRSNNKIHATAAYTEQGDGAAVCVQLDMQDGWHVNTHPATLDFLVDTDIQASVAGQPLQASIDWPRGQTSDITLDDQTIMVYKHDTKIPVRIDGSALQSVQQAGGLDLAIQVQACGVNGMCLMPSTINLAVKPEPGAVVC